jgi:hypothetical protein
VPRRARRRHSGPEPPAAPKREHASERDAAVPAEHQREFLPAETGADPISEPP